jgi:hypothetical protein
MKIKDFGCSYLFSLYYLICGHCSKSIYLNFIRLTPLMVARSWHRNGLDGILSKQPQTRIHVLPSPYLSLPLMSIVKIARYLMFHFKSNTLTFTKYGIVTITFVQRMWMEKAATITILQRAMCNLFGDEVHGCSRR